MFTMRHTAKNKLSHNYTGELYIHAKAGGSGNTIIFPVGKLEIYKRHLGNVESSLLSWFLCWKYYGFDHSKPVDVIRNIHKLLIRLTP